MPSTPKKLVDIHTRHISYNERLKSSNVKEYEKFLQQMATSVKKRLSGTKRITEYTKDRLDRLNNNIAEDLTNISNKVYETFKTQAKELAEYEANFEIKSLNQIINHSFVLPSTTQLNSAVFNTPLAQTEGVSGGKLLDSFFKDLSNSTVSKINGSIISGYYTGMTNTQIIQSIIGTKKMNFRDGDFSTKWRHMEAVVRTGLQHAANQARQETWNNNRDIIKGVIWLSTLDGRTSPTCRALDQKQFPVDSGPRPPAHVNCRSTTVAQLDDRFKILSEGRTRTARDPETGEVYSVDGNLSYYDWLKKESSHVQDSIIGPSRGKLLREGGLSSARFTELQLGKNFEPLTLKQMKALEPVAFQNAGVLKNFTIDELLMATEDISSMTPKQITAYKKTLATEITPSAKVILEVENLFKKNLDDISKTHPEVFDKASEFLSKVSVVVKDADIININGVNAVGVFDYDTMSIQIAGKRSFESSIKFGGFNVGSGIPDTIRHEVGHVIYETALNSDDKELFARAVKKMGGLKNLSKISEYASTNIKEAFSECFSVWTSSQHQYGTDGIFLNPYILNAFRDIFEVKQVVKATKASTITLTKIQEEILKFSNTTTLTSIKNIEKTIKESNKKISIDQIEFLKYKFEKDTMIGMNFSVDAGKMRETLKQGGKLKNQFELGEGYSLGFDAPVKGDMRDLAEMKFSNSLYSKSSGYSELKENQRITGDLAIERPVYGYVVDREQNRLYGDYGDFTFILKDSIKNRATLTMGDSINSSDTLNFFNFKNNDIGVEAIIKNNTSEEIHQMIDGMQPLKGFHDDYIEAQLHGEILISRDVESIVYDPRSTTVDQMDILKEAAKKFGIKLITDKEFQMNEFESLHQ